MRAMPGMSRNVLKCRGLSGAQGKCKTNPPSRDFVASIGRAGGCAREMNGNRRGCGIVTDLVPAPDRPSSSPPSPPSLFSPAHQAARPPRAAALRVALIYALIGAAWIFGTDSIVNAVFSPQQVQRYHIQ